VYGFFNEEVVSSTYNSGFIGIGSPQIIYDYIKLRDPIPTDNPGATPRRHLASNTFFE
jgi:hypothetical protein